MTLFSYPGRFLAHILLEVHSTELEQNQDEICFFFVQIELNIWKNNLDIQWSKNHEQSCPNSFPLSKWQLTSSRCFVDDKIFVFHSNAQCLMTNHCHLSLAVMLEWVLHYQ